MRLTSAKGLITSSNEVARVDGALSKADNVIIDYENVIQQRRGFKEYSQLLLTPPKQLLTYKQQIFAHYGTNISYDSASAGTFANFSGSYTELISGLRIKSLEASGNLYFTTNEGIKVISAKSASDFPTTAIKNAGAVEASDLSGKVVPDAAGFLPAQSKVAYRLLFGYKDANGNLHPGAPSSRVILTNQSQDVKTSEIFTVNIQDLTLIPNTGTAAYFTFDTMESGYFVWFKRISTQTAPISSETLDRQPILVDLTDSTVAYDEQIVAAVLGNAISNANAGVTVEITGTEVQVTIITPGNATDCSQGTLAVGAALVTKVFDGSIIQGTTGKTSLSFILPQEVDTTYYYQIYRTGIVSVSAGVTLNDIDPGDEHQFVFEAPVTSADITAGEITMEDITPEAFRAVGQYLYTNGITGEGITQVNSRPPVAQDIASFRNSTFYANTKDYHTLTFSLLSVDDFVSTSTKLSINQGTNTSTYTFVGSPEVTDITVVPRSSTTAGTHIPFNSANNEREYYIWFDKGSYNKGFDTYADVVGNMIVAALHKFVTGEKITYSGVNIGTSIDLTTGEYYVKVLDPNTIELYTDAALTNIVALTPSGTPSFGTLRMNSADPAVPGKVSIRIPMELYPDTIAGSKQALLDSLLSLTDFDVVDFDTDTVRLTCTDSGTVTDSPVIAPASGWTISVAVQGDGEDAAAKEVLLSQSASVGIAIDLTARSLVRVINKDPDCPVSATYLSGVDDLPGKILLKSKTLMDENFHLAISSSSLSAEFSPELPYWDGIASFPTTAASDNNEVPNRVMYSKLNQPEAVPGLNYIDIGSKDKQILRILPLRDNLFVLKEDGIFIITGSGPGSFSQRLLDNSAICIAPDSAQVLNNLIYCLSTQGVIAISDSGVQIVGRQIEDQVKKVTSFNYNYKYTSFGLSYESDRAYLLWLPTNKSDTVATQCFRYSTITNAWTRWTVPSTCGIVNYLGDDRVYLGGSGRNYVLQERKNNERQDYADRDFLRTLGDVSVIDNKLILSSAQDVAVGDVITQEQYLTVTKFNRMLKKLDSDNGTELKTYFANFSATQGSRLSNLLTGLIAQLNADANLGTFTTPSGLNTKEALQSDYNIMIGELNLTISGTNFKDYKTVTDLITYEVEILETTKGSNTVVVDRPTWFIEGDITIFKAIETEVEYAPQHFGKPEVFKQISEGTIIFDQGTISNATIGYASDNSLNFVDIKFKLDGPGFWAGFPWLSVPFGGQSNERGQRTLIPQTKSRCRYLHVRFKHKVARQQYKLLGISLEPREFSTRAYR